MAVKPMSLRTVILAKETGATYRQIDYWVETGLIPRDAYEVIGAPGSGSKRYFDETLVPVVKTMVLVAKKLRGGIKREILKDIYDNYQTGQIDLGDGITLTWEVE